MPTDPFVRSAVGLDLSPRAVSSSAIVGSPATNAETIVCQVPTISAAVQIAAGVFLSGSVAFTVGTSGTAVRVRIRQTNVAGTVVADSGAITGGVTAANLLAQDIQGFDTAPPAIVVYVLTLQVTAGAAISTVSATNLFALAV